MISIFMIITIHAVCIVYTDMHIDEMESGFNRTVDDYYTKLDRSKNKDLESVTKYNSAVLLYHRHTDMEYHRMLASTDITHRLPHGVHTVVNFGFGDRNVCL